MSSIVVLDQFDPPKSCSTCPFLNDDISCCDILSRVKGKAVLVNKYSSFQDIRCPFHSLSEHHGRLLDEKDIRACFAEMPFSSRDVRFSMLDVFSNIANVAEVAPRRVGKAEKIRQTMVGIGETIKQATRKHEDIQKEIENAGENRNL